MKQLLIMILMFSSCAKPSTGPQTNAFQDQVSRNANSLVGSHLLVIEREFGIPWKVTDLGAYSFREYRYWEDQDTQADCLEKHEKLKCNALNGYVSVLFMFDEDDISTESEVR